MTVLEETIEGLKKTEIGLIPHDWAVKKLGDVTRMIMGQSPPSSTYNEMGNGIPFLQGKAEFQSKFPRHIKYTTRPQKIAPQNSVLLSVRAPVGDVNIAGIDYCIGRGLASLSLNDGNNDFLFHLLTFYKSAIELEGTGSTFKAISKGKLEGIKIPLPPLPEQQKIASVLSTIQEAKEKTENVIKATKELRKSMMKHLFTFGPVPVEDAEKVPLKETEIGMIPEHWEVSDAQNAFFKVTDGTHDTPKKLLSGIPLIKSQQIKQGAIQYQDADYFISDADFNFINKRSQVDQYDILYSMIGTIGEVALVIENHKIAIKNVALFKTKGDKDLAKYSFYWLSSDKAHEYVNKNLAGATQKYISLGKLRTFPFVLPPLSERIEISELLSAIDEKISIGENKKRALESLFKTLLSLLMTGKLRVKDLDLAV